MSAFLVEAYCMGLEAPMIGSWSRKGVRGKEWDNKPIVDHAHPRSHPQGLNMVRIILASDPMLRSDRGRDRRGT